MAEDAIKLYDLTPEGNFTISKEGEIIKLNNCGSQMLSKKRLDLIRSKFGFFVSEDTRQIFNHFIEKVFDWKAKESCDVTLSTDDNFPMYVHLTGLSNSNVASRILPIQIHDLKPDDKVLVEKELGGFLRAVEFIYREPGVTRPLKPDDDDKVNLNRTKYRNQINKTANAIDEIINSLTSIPSPLHNEKPQTSDQSDTVTKAGSTDTLDKPVKPSKRKSLSLLMIRWF